MLLDIPNRIDDINKAINGSNPQLAFSISFSKAQDSFKAFTKDLSKELEIPKEVINESIIQQLKDLAAQGNKTAEALYGFMSGFKSITPVDSKAFNDAINESCDVLDGFLVKLSDFKNVLKDSDQLEVTTLYLQHLQSQLDKSVNDIASKFNMPATIIKEKIISRLKEFANQGDLVSQSLLNSWGNLSKPFDDLLNKAKDAVTYLGASPQEFTPALNAMAKGIQKIDPITGKVTEQFKKAHDALKEWANITFDKLTARIQKLRKAVEGGFIDQSALENELRRSLPQIKLQIISELEPMKNQFASQSDYQSIIASELVAKVQDLFGDVGTQVLRTIYDGMTGIDIGQSILRDLGLSGSQGYIKINGVEQSLRDTILPLTNALNNTGDSMLSFINSIRTPNDNNITSPNLNALGAGYVNYSDKFSAVIDILNSIKASYQSNISALQSIDSSVKAINFQPVNENNIAQAVSNGINPIVASLSAVQSSNDYVVKSLTSLSGNIDALRNSNESYSAALNSLQNSLNSVSGSFDFNSAVSPLTAAVQNLDNALTSILAIQQANSNALSEVITAVRDVQSVISSMNAGNNFDIDIIQQGFNVQSKSDADYAAHSAANALRSGLGNGGL